MPLSETLLAMYTTWKEMISIDSRHIPFASVPVSPSMQPTFWCSIFNMHYTGNQMPFWSTCTTYHAKPNVLPVQSLNSTPTASTLCQALRQHSHPFIPTIHCLFRHACHAMTTDVSSFPSPVYMHVPTLCALLWWQHSQAISIHNCLLSVFIFPMKPFTLIEYHVPRSRCQ
jgi:hypothetical protein